MADRVATGRSREQRRSFAAFASGRHAASSLPHCADWFGERRVEPCGRSSATIHSRIRNQGLCHAADDGRMRVLQLALALSLLSGAPVAMAGANASPGKAVPTTLRGLTVLECDFSFPHDCTLVSKEGHIVWVHTDNTAGKRFPEVGTIIGTVVDLRGPYWASGGHRDAFRGFELSLEEPGWVRPVGTTRCLVVYGYVGEVRDGGVLQLIAPVRFTPRSFNAGVAAENLIAFEPMSSRLARVQTTENNPRLRTLKVRALKLVRRVSSNGFSYYEVTKMGTTGSMRAGRCSA